VSRLRAQTLPRRGRFFPIPATPPATQQAIPFIEPSGPRPRMTPRPRRGRFWYAPPAMQAPLALIEPSGPRPRMTARQRRGQFFPVVAPQPRQSSPTASMTLSASQTGAHAGGGSSVTAAMSLAGSQTGVHVSGGVSHTAAMALSATRSGAKNASGSRTAAMVLAGSYASPFHASSSTRTAAMASAGSYSAPFHAAFSSRTAAMALATSYVAVHTSGGVLRTAAMVLAGSASGLHIIAEVQPLVARARLVVAYELLMMARIPQQSGPPTFLPIDPIDWTGLSYVDELSKPQQLTAGCTLSNLTDPVKDHLRDMAHQPTELWLYRAGKLVFAGPLFTWQIQQESLTLQASGILGYLQLMRVDTDTVFANADQFSIVTGLINNWENSAYGNFGLDTTSVGTSGVLRDATYLAKEDNFVSQRVAELGKRDNGFDISVDPLTRKLQLWYPQQGIDRSSGEDAIVFDERCITNANVMCSAAPGDVASDAFGVGTNNTGANPTTSTKWDDDLRVRYGRSAVSQTFDGVSEQATLDAHTQALLDARGNALMIPGPDARVTPDTDPSLYDVGDTVFYRLNSLVSVQGGFRVRKRTVTVQKTGQESVSLQFA
jgi:hypothetical protein